MMTMLDNVDDFDGHFLGGENVDGNMIWSAN